jgi:hypothetical protein
MNHSTNQPPAAEELRAAAAKLRKTAKNATPGRWTAEHQSWAGDNAVLSYATNGHAVAVCGEEVKGADHPASADAAWIALAHPGLAEPLAAWLESAAKHAGKVVDPANQAIIADQDALAVARVINGTVSRG